MSANLENLAVATGPEKVSFHSNPKECSDYRIIVLVAESLRRWIKAPVSSGVWVRIPSLSILLGLPCSSSGKKSSYDAGDQSLIPGLGRSSREGSGNLLRYSCLENPIDRGAWWATVHGVAKSWTGLSD